MAQLDITKWPVLSKLNEEFIIKIKLFFVFGDQAIIVTNEENVYALVNNNNGYICLKSNQRNIIQEPTLIEELCQKYVIDIQLIESINYLSYKHEGFVLALTRNNQVFSWGSNDYGQLGNGSVTDCYFPNVIIELIGRNVTDIKCRKRYCLALTQSGEVYYWGNELVYKPTLMVNIKQENIISISCGNTHSLALTDEGKVYSWGDQEIKILNKNVFTTNPSLISTVLPDILDQWSKN